MTVRPVIGFFAPTLNGYYFGSILDGVHDVVRPAGARIMAIQTADSGLAHHSVVDDPFTLPLAWDHLDAFVVVLDAVNDDYLRSVHATGKPIVLISREVPGLDCPAVVPDNPGAIVTIVDHLIDHGHERIAFVGRTPDCTDDRVRQVAYEERMQERGMTPFVTVPVSWEGEEVSAQATAEQIVAADPRPTAAVVSTDVTAIMLVQALRRLGVEAPGDVAVVGFDDIDDAATHRPPLTTVAQSFPLVGSTAGHLVLAALNGQQPAPGRHHVPVSFVIRESCGCPSQRVDPTIVTTTGGARDRFAGELLAVLHDGPQAQWAAPRDQSELISGLFDRGGLTRDRLQELSALAERVVRLFTAVGDDPAGDRSAEVAAVGEAIYQLVPHDQDTLGVVGLLRRFARALSTEAAARSPGGGMDVEGMALLARLDDLAFDLGTAALGHHLHGRPTEYLYFQQQRRHYEISTDLLRRENRGSRSLAWLSQTEARAGCLALWCRPDDTTGFDGGRRSVDDRHTLDVIATHRADGPVPGVDGRYPMSAFPPEAFLDLSHERPDDLVYLLPVRFDGSNWGVLAVLGPLSIRKQIALQMYNHWAVLLTVALDQERAVYSLVNQQENLVAAYERERTLTEEIRVSEERYALAADAANDGLWDWNVATGTVYYSTRWKSLLGYTENEIDGQCREWLDRVHPDDRPALDRALAHQFDGHATTFELEYRMRAGDGSFRWMLTRARSVRDHAGTVTRMVGSMTDVDDRKYLEDQLRRDALYDGLTGLPNRTLFLDRLNQAIEQSRRRPEHRFAVVFLDLDGFKFINDSLGHQSGDQVLVQVAHRFEGQMRANDTVSRFGGDEFVILIDDVASMADLSLIVERILATLSSPIALGAQTVVISAAAGIAVSTTGYDTAEDCIRDADTAMYRAKAVGNGTSVVFDESMHTGVMARLRLESDLRQALADGQFELHYQPILRLDTRRVVGLEALIRWRHPTRGMVRPDEFLAVAEATGLILQIGWWTIDEVCRHLRGWRRGNPAARRLSVSVNLSNRQFWDPELRARTADALRRHRIPPTALVFEITEGVIMHNPETATSLMHQLRNDGFALHVDDFGTGYSSLEALHTFPINALKIDRSFVARMTTDARSRELVRIMAAMGRNLGVEVIAEGIETEEQAEALAELGCPRVQGYLFSRPVPAGEVPGLLAGNGPAVLAA